MRNELAQEVVQQFPAWFNVSGGSRNTRMLFGFQFGDGWYHILLRLCADLEPMVTKLEKKAGKGTPLPLRGRMDSRGGTTTSRYSAGGCRMGAKPPTSQRPFRHTDFQLICQEFPLSLEPVSDFVARDCTSFEVDFIGSKSHVIFRNG